MTAASRVWPGVQCAGVFQPLSPEIPHFLSPAAHLLLFAYISPLFFAYCQETLSVMVYVHQWNRNIAWRLVLVLYDPVFTRCSLRNEGATCKHQVQISFILLFCFFVLLSATPFILPGRQAGGGYGWRRQPNVHISWDTARVTRPQEKHTRPKMLDLQKNNLTFSIASVPNIWLTDWLECGS